MWPLSSRERPPAAQVLLQLRLLPRRIADVARRGVERDQVAHERHELVPTLPDGGHCAFLQRRSKGLAHLSSSGSPGAGRRDGSAVAR